MVNQTNLLQPNVPTQQIQAQVGGYVRQQQPYQPVISAYATQPVLDPRVMLQPGFTNTSVEQVRLSNQSSQAQAGGFLGPQAFVPQQQLGLHPVPQVIGPQQPYVQGVQAFAHQSPSVMLQPGYAGTSLDQVIQSNQLSQAHAGGYLGPQAFIPQQQIGIQPVTQVMQQPQLQWSQAYTQQLSPSVMLQPGFAGTNLDQVIQSNQRSQAQAGGFYGPQAIVQQQPQQQILAYVPQTQQPIYQPIVR